MQKIALITGANKGIGFETARQLGKLSYTVLMAARDSTLGQSATNALRAQEVDAHFVLLNPTDAQSVLRARQELEKKFGVLDVLINNAGTMLDADQNPANLVPTAALRETYEINVFGLHEVTCAFWPLLNRSKAARLVNVSSALGSLALHSQDAFGDFRVIAYDSSKAAVNMMTIHYAKLWQGTPHRANTIHPGSVKTDLNPEGTLSVEEGAKTSVSLATMGEDCPNGGFFHLGKTLPW